LTDPFAREGVSQPVERSARTYALIAGGIALLALLAFLIFNRGDEDQDKLIGNETSTAAPSSPEKRCASAATYDRIKRELFRRAAQVRGSDQAAFDKLAAYATIRMERPVLESQDGARSVACSGSVSIDLPPGVAVVGGRRTLTADVDYALQRAADGSGEVLTLSGADAIVTPLATLSRTQQAPRPVQEPLNTADPTYDGPGEIAPALPATPPVNPPPPASRPATAQPSFNCANARTRGEIAVCNDNALAALDRQMATHFNRAMAAATPGERAMLTRSRNRFLAFRDRCASDACIADAYRGRIAEITDIMSGRFEP
jgi:hypothetical protein